MRNHLLTLRNQYHCARGLHMAGDCVFDLLLHPISSLFSSLSVQKARFPPHQIHTDDQDVYLYLPLLPACIAWSNHFTLHIYQHIHEQHSSYLVKTLSSHSLLSSVFLIYATSTKKNLSHLPVSPYFFLSSSQLPGPLPWPRV